MKRSRLPGFVTTPVKWLLAICLLPVVVAAFFQLIKMGPFLHQEGWKSWWLYLVGAASYVIFERLFHKPMWLYVIGHELTHAVSGFLSGARIYKFKVSSKGGEVRLSKTNTFVALSPYVLPFYLILVLVFYAILKNWYDTLYLDYGFQLLLGATLAFHVLLTINAVHKHQPDLKGLGLILSAVVITLANTLILGLLAVSLFKKTPTLKEYASGILNDSIKISTGIYNYAVPRASSLLPRIKEGSP